MRERRSHQATKMKQRIPRFVTNKAHWARTLSNRPLRLFSIQSKTTFSKNPFERLRLFLVGKAHSPLYHSMTIPNEPVAEGELGMVRNPSSSILSRPQLSHSSVRLSSGSSLNYGTSSFLPTLPIRASLLKLQTVSLHYQPSTTQQLSSVLHPFH